MRRRGRTSLLARGEAMKWLTGGAFVICLVMILGLLALVLYQGTNTFWPRPVVTIASVDGKKYMGEVSRSESFPLSEQQARTLHERVAERALARLADGDETAQRRLIRTGNFDLTNTHFEWVEDFAVDSEVRDEWACVVERRAWGRFYGTPTRFEIDGETVAASPLDVWSAFQDHHADATDRHHRVHRLQKKDLGHIYALEEEGRLALRSVELRDGTDSPAYLERKREFEAQQAELERQRRQYTVEIDELKNENQRYRLVMTTIDGQEASLALDEIVRAYPANQLAGSNKLAIYFSRWWEFLADDPREANSEGGVWPAIVGTVIMTLLMSVAVVPFGVLAALYLREYAKAGALVSAVRIAVNNLAGVPSIVFGVFGLGFFCYIVGASIDELLFAAKLPNPTYGKGGVMWASLTLALLTLPVVVVATEEALAAVPSSMRQGSYACGASKWQTIRRIVLPRAMPGIMTGLILAMARGAGEVAPLMLVGAVKLAPELPIDSIAPFLHPDRSFMHLGFHIYDVGFQSQNSEAAKPMVFTTTLLLISIIAGLNVSAVWVRTRLRRKFLSTQF